MFDFVPTFQSLALTGDFFYLDRWSWLFIFLILLIGAVIIPFAVKYFDSPAYRLKFFGAFFPFMLAMLGLVAFNHLILFFICWELTSILSYFLIAFKGSQDGARRSALHTALITGGGGLCLLGGIILLGVSTGSWTFSAALHLDWSQVEQAHWIAALFLIGAFTKSAQFPFNFWLPRAMSAPTPASAYLHSATMVKAGVFLIYRMEPVFSSLDWFTTYVAGVGMLTFTIGAFFSIFQNDLKGALASTTLSNLGLITALVANPFPGALDAAVLVVLGHALYKAALFLFAGVIEHSTHTRSIDRLQGLREYYPKTALLGVALAGANMGLPLTVGFYAKAQFDWPILMKTILIFGGIFLSKAGLLVAVKPFLGTFQGAALKEVESHPPHPSMLFGPLLLGILSWTLPLFSASWVGPLSLRALELQLDLDLAVSLCTAGAAVALYQFWRPSWTQWWEGNLLPDSAHVFDLLWFKHIHLVGKLSQMLQNGHLAFYLSLPVLCFLLGIPLLSWTPQTDLWPSDANGWVLASFMIIQWASTFWLLKAKTPVAAVVFLGGTGFALSLIFALLNAPDLAITQLSIECLSLFLFALVFRKVSQLKEDNSSPWTWRRPLALTVGVTVGILVYHSALQQAPSQLMTYFGEKSYLEAHGRNVVNVILVDFRGVDTLGEITVLVLAALGVMTLLTRRTSP